ncbi:MAG: DNA polymerase I [Nannocystaceae bacterium]
MATAPRLILVDGSALIYRAYYAIPANFTTAAGLHTNAIYGFATMFRRILGGRQPERGAVIFDAPGPTFREEKYPAYKAQRPPMDPTLREQLSHIDRLVEAHEFPLLRVPGYEADDVIGTLARQAAEAGMDVLIVSGDKDFAQLIGDRIAMIDTLQNVTYDRELVRKKWGVVPERFVDYLALVGDKVDNIPGVPGIGQKGASQLLEAYGDLDGVLAAVDQLKGKQKTALTEHRADALLSRDLATIDTRVPLALRLDDLGLKPPDRARLNALFRELEFYSLLAEEEQGGDEAEDDTPVTIVADPEELTRRLAAIDPAATVALFPVIDPPSAVRSPLAALAIAAAGSTEPAIVVPLSCAGGLGERGVQALRPWLADPSRRKVAHDAKALWIALRRQDVELAGVVGDTLLESFLVDPTKLIPHRIDQVIKEYLRRTVPPVKRAVSGKGDKALADLEAAAFAAWASKHAVAIAEAWPKIRARVVEDGQLKYLEEVELPLSWVLGAMELDGIAVDPASLNTMGQEFRERLAGYEAKIHEIAGRKFNIASTKQLGAVLFDELGLPVIKKNKSGYSTDAEVLERLAPKHEIAHLLLEHRRLAKLINTYTDVLQAAVDPRDGRIHATFQQTVSATGRLITTDPDLQRTPVKTPEGRRIRQTFVAAPGKRLISADWSQIELRLLAHVSHDALLVEAFSKGLDVHRRTAAQIFGCGVDEVSAEQRATGKLVNFATIYGQGATALAQILGVARKDAQGYIDAYFAAYAGVRTWLDAAIEGARERGYVTTLMGRRRYIPELSSKSVTDRAFGERVAANTPIQGSAAELCKLAMLAIDRRLREAKIQARMLLQIHDELVFEAPIAEVDAVCAIAREEMERAFPLDVPLVVDVGVGETWGDAH